MIFSSAQKKILLTSLACFSFYSTQAIYGDIANYNFFMTAGSGSSCTSSGCCGDCSNANASMTYCNLSNMLPLGWTCPDISSSPNFYLGITAMNSFSIDSSQTTIQDTVLGGTAASGDSYQWSLTLYGLNPMNAIGSVPGESYIITFPGSNQETPLTLPSVYLNIYPAFDKSALVVFNFWE